MNPALTLRTPPRYGRRAAVSLVGAAVFTVAFFCIRVAAANQVGASETPATWALYLAAVSLYYAGICTFLWLRRRPRRAEAIRK